MKYKIKKRWRWEDDLAEYRQLLIERMTDGERETCAEIQLAYKRDERINVLYNRLW